jgi:acyl phosphate:glycerol-3-phosphate acyltransferase
MLSIIIFFCIGYLIGSFPTAILVSKIFGLPDPRTQGSGNPGATNVLRTGNKTAATLVLLVDMLKGALGVGIAYYSGLQGEDLGIVSIAPVLGHIYPVFSNFKGGKGVATCAGVLLVLCWQVGLPVIATWVVVASVTRYSSVAALVAACSAPIYSILFSDGTYHYYILALTMIILVRHSDNIIRLISGKENKIDI